MRLALICVFFLTGCAGIQGQRYLDQTPQFDLFEFFDGKVVAYGIVQGRDGNLLQKFSVTIDGQVQGDELVLDEFFEYQLGQGPEYRQWRIQKTDSGFTGGATDIPPNAVGQSYGSAFNWQYSMDLPVGDGTLDVAFDDWFWAMDGDRLMNRSVIKKFGLTLAEVTLFMERVQD